MSRHPILKPSLFIFLCLLLTWGVAPVSAATLTVNTTADSGAGSLREAITNAVNGDTIVFSTSGTITLASQLDISQNLTINGTGQTIAIDGNAAERVLCITATGTVNLTALTIQNGFDNAPCLGNTGVGGGIANLNGAVVNITDSTLSNNVADTSGGGIYNGKGTINLTNSTLSGNISNGGGGGIFNVTALGIVNVVNSTLISNTADGNGGGIVTVTNATTNVTSSTLEGNTAANGSGGGIYNGFGTTNVVNSTLYGNAGENGGGIYNRAGTLSVINSTLSGNNASLSSGGGVYTYGSGGAATANVQNTIVAGNTAATSGPDVFSSLATFTSLGNNLIGDNAGATEFTNGANGDLVGNTASPINPLLGVLSNNGEATNTLPLQIGSPAIDAGNDATCAAAPVNGVDQRGNVRPVGSHCDIGAYEYGTASSAVPAAPTAIPSPALCSLTGFASSTQVAMSLPNGNNGLNVCYSLLTEPAQAGVTQVFTLAVDVYTFRNIESVSETLSIQVCLQGAGTLLYRSAVGQPRVTVNLPSFSQNGFTCGLIPNAGTVILIPGAAAPAANPITPLSQCRVTTTNILNLRAAPDATSAILTKVPYQTTLSASARSGEWLQVVFGSQQGWLSAGYLTLDGACA
jgi:hypothetical protein